MFEVSNIFLGNGIQEAANLPNMSVQLTFLDPPWLAGNRQANGYSYDDNLSIKDYTEQYVSPVLGIAMCKLKIGGTLAVWTDYRAAPYWGMGIDKAGLIRRGEIIVESGLGSPGKNNWPMKHSNITIATKGNGYFDVEALPMVERLSATKKVNGKEYSGEKRVASVMRYTLSNTDQERVGYPDQKPLYVCEAVVKAYTRPGDIVLDLTCGSGTIPLAAQNTGRIGIGFDISQKAVELGLKRLGIKND